MCAHAVKTERSIVIRSIALSLERVLLLRCHRALPHDFACAAGTKLADMYGIGREVLKVLEEGLRELLVEERAHSSRCRSSSQPIA
jgi:hypothetical protein